MNPDPNRPDKEILELLKINLKNNAFEFNSQWYLQTWGTSVGKKCAPNYAKLFLAEWEEKALEKCVLKPSVYWRFLDDIFMIWEHSKEDFYKFVKILNTHHPSITVKAELSSESMHFLDTVVYKGNRFRGRVHLIPKFILNQQILWNCYTRNHITQTILLRDLLSHTFLDMFEYVITNKM